MVALPSHAGCARIGSAHLRKTPEHDRIPGRNDFGYRHTLPGLNQSHRSGPLPA